MPDLDCAGGHAYVQEPPATKPMKPRGPTGHLSDAWVRVDDARDPEFYVRFLEASRAPALAHARAHPQAFFAHLKLESGVSVLDCGCGTGEMLAVLAPLVFPGRALGVDSSATMIERAHRVMSATLPNLSFERRDIESLADLGTSFDRVLADQLLVHLHDPRLAMQRLCAATSAGGMVALVDADWDTMIMGCGRPDLGRRFTHAFCDTIRNGSVVREYPGWLADEGMVDITVIPRAVPGAWQFLSPWVLEPSMPHFVESGVFTAEEARIFTADLQERADSGRFFGGLTFYTVTARRPT